MEQSKRRRKKNVYVEYDYEEAYQKQIENLEEDIIKRMMDGKKIKYVYATKEIKAGEQLEVEIYPEFTRKREEEIPEEGRRKKDRQAQRNLNEKNSRKQCERVINENFGDRDIWATFTYSAEYTPASMKVAKSHMQNYIRRLNYQRKKRGLPNARYVYVTEQGDKGRWHHHIVLDGDMDMDTVESLWTYGKRNQVRRLQKDENGLVGMAKYVSKPKGKGKDSEEGKYQKIWTPSKNLKKPDEHKNHYKTKQSHVDKMGAWEENDAHVPKLGEGVLYDWEDTGIGDNTGNPDHVGTVTYVNQASGYFVVTEGNFGNAVKKRTISINGRYIRGFITPKYDSDAAQSHPVQTPGKSTSTVAHEVIAGQWGNGDARKNALKAAGYDPAVIQAEVNKILNGSAVTTTKPQQKDQPITKTVKSTCYAKSYDRSLAGTYKTTDALYCRNDAGSNKKALCVIPAGTEVHNYGYYTTYNGVKWLYITVTLDGVEYIGFSSKSYLKK